jgi:predicted Zn-dependent protease
MSRLLFLVLSTCLLGCSTCPVDKKGAQHKGGITVVFVRCADVDRPTLDRVENFLGANLPVKIVDRNGSSGMGQMAPAKQGEEVGKLLSSGESCVVALVAEPENSVQQSILLATNKASAIVNLSGIRSRVACMVTGKEEEYQRLCEKETMRAIGYMLGLKTCPNPDCAMSDYLTKPGMRVQGRNFCPPCCGIIEERLKDSILSPELTIRAGGGRQADRN